MRVIILSGIPGSGKSTLARERFPDAIRVSADDYFMTGGEYRFDPAKLGEAHGVCLRDFIDAIRTYETRAIVVDNTNLSVAEIAPYAALAQAYGAELQIITVLCDPAIAAARNIHGVPADAVQRMHDALAKRELPPWWPQETLQRVMRYAWQDPFRAADVHEDFTIKSLIGLPLSNVWISIPAAQRPPYPLYLRLEPDAWPLTIAVLAYLCDECPTGSRDSWFEVLRQEHGAAIYALRGDVEPIDDEDGI